MINSDGSLNVINEDGINVKIDVLFDFEIEEFGKKYIAYTTDSNPSSSEQEVFISELDNNTYTIKSIPEEDMKYVLNMYKKIREELLNS